MSLIIIIIILLYWRSWLSAYQLWKMSPTVSWLSLRLFEESTILGGLSRLLNLSLKINPLTLWVRALPLFKSTEQRHDIVCMLSDRQTNKHTVWYSLTQNRLQMRVFEYKNTIIYKIFKIALLEIETGWSKNCFEKLLIVQSGNVQIFWLTKIWHR